MELVTTVRIGMTWCLIVTIVGEVITVEIQKVEKERGRISLGWPGKTPATDWGVAG